MRAGNEAGRRRDVGHGARRRVAGAIIATGALALVLAAPALAAAPRVTTGAASAITFQSATLSGTVNPSGSATVVYYQFGTTSKYGAQTAPDQLAAGTARVTVSLGASGLAPNTVYHFRVVATNASGTTLGADKTFTTAKIPLSLATTAVPNPVPYGAPVTIEGTLSGTGSAGRAVQLQATPFPYTAGFANVGNPELTLATGSFAFNVLGAAQTTQYRVVTVNGAVVSGALTVPVSVDVTLHAQSTGSHRHPAIHFTGTIAPAEPSARIAVERLIGKSWKVVAGTIAHANTVNGVVTYGLTAHTSGGFFRTLVLPVEGGHVSGYSQVALVRTH